MTDKTAQKTTVTLDDASLFPYQNKLAPWEILVCIVGAFVALFGLLPIIAAIAGHTSHGNPVIYPLLGVTLILFGVGAPVLYVRANRMSRRIASQRFAQQTDRTEA